MNKVYLVGAGPGNAGLITIRGLQLLQSCDCVVYDRLSSLELLSFVKPDCTKIYVGKEPGKHSKKQEEINEILVSCGKKYKRTVRLKGGDPFVFGRGGEEIYALEENGISYELIPGVTSAVSVPELAGIPVTHREVARSFHVITGHTKTSQGAPDYDYETIAQMEGTILFLMGLSHLKDISAALLKAGMDAQKPAAVISNGGTPFQKTVRGNLKNIAELTAKAGLTSPAIIVIGETASFSFDTKESREKIGVIATDALWEKFAAALDDAGYLPIRLSRMELRIMDTDGLAQQVKQIHQYDWVVFTSQNAISLFFQSMGKNNVDYRCLSGVKFAVIGSGTGEALKHYGFHADFIPKRYTAEDLAEELSKMIHEGEHILLPRALQSNPVLAFRLRTAGALVTDLPIYDVEGVLTEDCKGLEEMNTILLASGSGARGFAKQLQEAGLCLSSKTKIACIGEVTARAARESLGPVDITATVNDVQGLVDALRRQK